MGKTSYQIQGRDFYINDRITYSEIPGVKESSKGLLFNARFIQGLFQYRNQDGRFDRFGKKFDPERNTDELIAALPQWYRYGLRAFTVGLMGGGPCMSHKDWGDFEFGSFSADGKTLDESVKARLVRVIQAADELGMLVIVSFLYHGQFRYLGSDEAVENACKTATEFLCSLDYDNIIIEVANEYDVIQRFVSWTELGRRENMAALVEKVRGWCGGRFAVGSSFCDFDESDRLVMQASDVCLFHGNHTRRETLHERARRVREWCPDKPLVVNEDSAMATQLDVAFEDHFSWGYYNNMTKQEPPCDWGVTDGEDRFFAQRMAEGIGIDLGGEDEDRILLQGFEPHLHLQDGARYIRVACRHPERIDRVRFYEDDRLLDVSFDEPFYYRPLSTWHQDSYLPTPGSREFRAEVVMLDRSTRQLIQKLDELVW